MRRASFLTLVAVAVPLSAAQVTTVADLNFLGGQHFFGGSASSVAGNFTGMVAPAVAFNDRWSLIPTWQGEYRGTRDVQELAGGGTLFQDSTRQSLTVKGVRAAGAWKYKASLGASDEWLRETKDEDWGKGLFDNRKFSGGVEAEYDFSKALGGRLAYDYYTLAFPNYRSLETAADPTLARELAGTKVLDSKSHLLTFSMWSPFPGKMRAELGAYYNLRSFDDQNTLDSSGQFTGTGRQDKTLNLSAGLGSRAFTLGSSRVLGDLDLSYGMNESNQNHFDASQTYFVPKYYNYTQWAAQPRITAALGEKHWVVTAGLGYTKRQYSDRLVQDAEGVYQASKTRITETTASLGLTYPYSKNFKVRAVGSMAWSDSNMNYERVFRYKYKIANYLVGFSYEY